MSAIECWVTDAHDTYLAHLERSPASPFRNFTCSRLLGGAAGAGSFEYSLPNALLADPSTTLLAMGNLVHMKVRGRTITWVIETRSVSTDGIWHQVSGPGVKAMVGDRVVWPVPNIDSTPTPKEWGKGNQWRRFVNRAAGEMLWDLLSESNTLADGSPRFATQFTRGHVGGTPDDGWTQKFRFDNMLDIFTDVEASFGDVDFDGLEYNYWSSGLGDDKSETVILEEGVDLKVATLEQRDRETLTWVIAEGTGEGVVAKTALGTNVGASQRRREAFLAAKDLDTVPALARAANRALKEGLPRNSLQVELVEKRYLVGQDYDLGDVVTVIADSRGIRDSSRIVALYFGEEGERLVIKADVNTKREEQLLRLGRKAGATSHGLGVISRQPQGQLVPFAISNSGIFDSDQPLETHTFIPDRMFENIECMVAIDFRPFISSARAASSGGGSTSGASSASSSGASSSSSSGAESGGMGWSTNTFPTSHQHVDPQGGNTGFMSAGSTDFVTDITIDFGHTHTIAHTHGIPHTHTTPAHTHGLDFGTFEEAYPASHDVTLRVYELVAGAWVLRTTVAGLTDDVEEVDLSATITGPGKWRIDLESAGGQPNNGRLAAHVSGYVLGAIQSE